MERVVEMVRMEDYCPSCHSKYSIELYDVYGNPLGLTRLLNRNMLEEGIKEKRISYMKCKKCNKDFRIYHHNGRLMPLDTKLNIEFDNFNESIHNNVGILYRRRDD